MNLIVFAGAFLFSLILVYGVRQFSLRGGWVSRPRQDRWHRRATPALGGVGIFLAAAGSLSLNRIFGAADELPVGILLGAAIVFVLGLYDDLKRLSPPAKLGGQILAAAVVISFGYTSGFFTPRIPDSLLAQLPNTLLTFFWLVGITNAINLLDNMDGLAGGIALIAAALLGYMFWESGSQGLLWVTLALAGSVLGFLVFNFPPASIFMGDSGSQVLGFTLAALAIARQPQASNVFAVLGVPTLLFLLPILDTVFVTFTRLLRGDSPVQGGRDHTSHRLIAFGLSERQAVLALYSVALVSGLMAVVLESIRYWFSLILVPGLVVSLALMTAYLGGIKISSGPLPKRERALTRIMLDLTFKRRLLEVMLDFFLIGLAFYLAFLTRSGFVMDSLHLELFLQALPVALGVSYLSFFGSGVYRGVWRYVGIDELLRYLKAALGSAALCAAVLLGIYSTTEYPAATFILYAVFLFLGLAAARFSFRILDRLAGRKETPAEERILIWGAGDTGELTLRWLALNPDFAYRPVGFIDEDPFKIGRQIHGIEVLGGLEHLGEIIETRKIRGVILAAELAPDGNSRENIAAICRSRGCWVRGLRWEFEPIEIPFRELIEEQEKTANDSRKSG